MEEYKYAPFLSQVQSPSAQEMGRYGRTPVSYFHGLPNISISLTEVRGRGFTLPISLSYHAGGNKPQQHPGWVGQGWSLNAGGCIVRVVNGKRDEVSSIELPGRPANPDYLSRIDEVQTETDWESKNKDNVSIIQDKTFDKVVDYAPDEYIISAPGIHASFFFTGEGKISVVSKDESAIELESYDLGDDSSNPALDMYPGKCDKPIKACRYRYFRRFVIRDKYGNRYFFGGNDDAIEYSVIQDLPGIPINPTTQRPDVNLRNNGKWNAIATANAWMLTRIECADGEIITFEYEHNGVPIVLNDIHHGEMFVFKESQNYYLNYHLDTYKDMLAGVKSNLNFSFLMPSYLKRIKCHLSGDELSFETEDAKELAYDINEVDFNLYVFHHSSLYDTVGPFTFAEFQSESRYRQLSKIHGVGRDVRFSFTSDLGTRLKLKSVSLLKDEDVYGMYTFSYNGTSLPPYNSRMTDVWGYYNGISYADLLAGDCKNMKNRRVAVESKMQAEILTCITYPTGGRTEFEYEAHRYSKMCLPSDFSLVDCPSGCIAGGLRIKSITDYPISSKPSTRSFEYVDEYGCSSGILTVDGECRTEGECKFYDADANFILFGEMPILPLSMTDGSHITYSMVRERFPDGSFVEYHYSNSDDPSYRDCPPTVEAIRFEPCPLYPEFTSKELSRGLLLKKDTFNSEGALVLSERMTYADAGDEYFKSVHQRDYFSGRSYLASYVKNDCGYPALICKEVTRYLDGGQGVDLLKEVYAYSYNRLRLLESSDCRRDVHGESEVDSISYGEHVFYPEDRTGKISEMMRNAGMHGVPVGKAVLRDGKVVSGTEIEYTDVTAASDSGDDRVLLLPFKTYSADLESPVTLMSYKMSPMSFLKSTPDIHAKSWDSRGNVKFIGLRNGSAVEQHCNVHTGQPSMRLKTVDSPLDIHFVRSANVRIKPSESVCYRADFKTTIGSMLSVSLGSDYGYAWHVCVQLDDSYGYLAVWSIPESPDKSWQSLLGMYGSVLTMNVPAGEHTLVISRVAWQGPTLYPEAMGGTVQYSYSELAPFKDVSTFVDLDTDSETGEGFHCEKGHDGPLEVSHSVTAGRSYILDYMLMEDGVWRYVSIPYIGGAVTIGGEGKTVSNVRIYPADSMPESFMWRRFTGMSARSDARGVTESYGYDDAGRLSAVRDNSGSLVRAYSYEFMHVTEEDEEAEEIGEGTLCGENRIITDEFISADGTSKRSSVNHYDDLGRLIDNVLVGGSPAGGDIVSRHEFDSMDRETKIWLPTADPVTADDIYGGDEHAYAENVYEASPLDKLLRKYGPGDAWRTADKAVRMYQKANKEEESDPTCHRGFSISWLYNSLTLSRNQACTVAGLLLIEQIEDEDGRTRLDFKNVHGETVLSRSVCDDGTWNDTHFIYDGFGRLAAVLPPKLTAMLESSGRSSWTESDISDLAYLYRYDGRGNNIAKLLPGGGWTWFIYDKGDRLVLSQDVIQREQGQWTFRLEDLFGRECVTGTAVLEMDVFADPLGEVNVYVTMPASPSYADTLKGYMATGLSFGSGTDILKVNYYDGYGFLGSGPFPTASDQAVAYDSSAEIEYGTRYSLSERGLATGSLVRVLDSSGTASYLWSVAYHDDRGRPVQACESMPSGGYRREYYAYDFTGSVTRRKSVLTPASGQAVTVVQTFTYDHMGRPVSVTHQIDDHAPRTVSLKTYDEIGRLSTEQRNGLASLIETRSYNLRSWLTGIDSPLFKEALKYHDGTTPQWGGNISEMSWVAEAAEKTYRFGYDALSRLVSADYSVQNVSASENSRGGGLIGGGGIIGGEVISGSHSENYHYDRNGNMDLHGRGNLMTMIGIEGNRITSVGSKAISYDAKGRQVSSAYGKAVATQYNILDLPQKHTVGNGDVVVDYRYAADGRKLQEKVKEGRFLQTSRDYLGEFIYENGTLKKILFDGGYVDMIGDTPVYMFFIKDHLGSVRAVISETGEVLQINEFYPYGDLFSTAGTADNSSDNRYRFTGKELSDETGLYDFSARFLQTSLGRFTTIDPLAEKYQNISPYAYCNGNPVNFVDPDGMDWYAYYLGRQDSYENMLPYMSYAWTEAKSQEELDALGIQGTYMGEAVVVFDGFYDEKLGKDGTLTGEGAKPADVTIYGVNGSDDIAYYAGLTVSSDPEKYSMIQDGEYKAFHQQMGTSVYGKDSLTYRISDMKGSLDLHPIGGINKYNGTSIMTEIFLHRTDTDGRATRASVGCLVIDGRSWRNVEKQLGKSSNIYIKLTRR